METYLLMAKKTYVHALFLGGDDNTSSSFYFGIAGECLSVFVFDYGKPTEVCV